LTERRVFTKEFKERKRQKSRHLDKKSIGNGGIKFAIVRNE